MQPPTQSVLLRIFCGEEDTAPDGRPLYEAIVTLARDRRLAGATVLRGPLGFGRSSALHTAKILRLSEDLPVVVEIVDSAERIDALVGEIMNVTQSCLITREKVEVIRYGTGQDRPE